jgi:hypothetical protein
MPTRKIVDADGVSTEPKKRASASKPKAPAATHKRAAKQNIEPDVPTGPVRVISHEEISCRAYSYWEARGFQGGSPEEDWFRAERELSELAQDR